LQALSGFKLKIHFVQNIIKDYTHLTNSGKTIILCWIPSHVNNLGNQCKKTYQFKTQCKGDISHAFETAKIIVFDPVVCKNSDAPLQNELLY